MSDSHHNFVSFRLILISCSELGLFGTDVVTDWLNGSNLIQEGQVAWGLLMVMLPFLPGAVVGVYVVWSLFHKKEYFKFFLSVLFYVPGVVLGTPYYMIIVILASCVKLFKPDLDKEDKVFGWIDAGFFKQLGRALGWEKLWESHANNQCLVNFLSSLLSFQNQMWI